MANQQHARRHPTACCPPTLTNSVIFPTEEIQRDGKTFTVPRRDSISDTDPTDKRRRFFDQTYAAIFSGNGKFSTKVNAFPTRFNIGAAKFNEAQNRLVPLYDPSTHAIDLTHPQIFTFTDFALQRNTGQVVEYAFGGAAINVAIRAAARYFGASLRIDPSQAHDSCTIPPMMVHIAIRLPLEHGTHLAPVVTPALLTNPQALITALTKDANGIAPDIGILMKNNGHLHATNNCGQFLEKYVKYYSKCLFSITALLIRNAFVGIVTPGRASMALQNCRQVYNDPTSRTLVFRTVQEYYTAFSTTLLGMPIDQPYGSDIASLFYNNLERGIQNMMVQREFVFQPPIAGKRNSAAQARLTAVYEFALRMESKSNALALRLRTRDYPQRSNQSNTPHSFFTFFTPPSSDPYPNSITQSIDAEMRALQGINDDKDDTTGNLTVDPTAVTDQPDLNTYLPNLPPADAPNQPNQAQLFHAAAVYLSVAEEAISRATGMPAPPRECWGCTDTKHHPSRFHLFRDCPNRNDPDVRQNFAKRLGFFRQNCPSNSYGPNHTPTNSTTPASVSHTTALLECWETNGWPSLECALIVSSIADSSASPQSRRNLMLPLYTALARQLHTSASQRSTNQPQPTNDHSYYGPSSYFNLMVTLPASSNPIQLSHFQTTTVSPAFTPHQPSSPVSFSQVLPHLWLPIGPRAENQGTICCLVDTGASLNVGQTEYHRTIYQNRPDLVVDFAMLKDEEGSQPFTIGGINGDGPPTNIDAKITYKTPYVICRQPVTVTFALGPTIATNSILAFPFLQRIKASLLFENMTCVSAVLGDTFHIDAMVPHQADCAPTIPEDAPAAYPSTCDVTTLTLTNTLPSQP